MPYSDKNTLEIISAYTKWLERLDELLTSYLTYTAATERGGEFITHGLGRRLTTLKHAITRLFDILPPQATEPSQVDIRDATIYLQSFVINVYGSLDNIARIWCLETTLKGSDGRPIRSGYIGLGPKNTAVRKSLSPLFQEYLQHTNEWFDYLENYRHALAHRIPLYIPPKQLNQRQTQEWLRLESELNGALKARDYEAWGSLLAEQKSLGVFEPVMMHSFGEEARPIRFHVQMIADLATVVEIGERMIDELSHVKR